MKKRRKKIESVVNGIRSKERVKNSGEVMTPLNIVWNMISLIPDEDWKNPNFPVLEPSCGNGNFVLYIIAKKISMGLSPLTACVTTFAVDICEDNINDTRQRIMNFLKQEKMMFCNGNYINFHKPVPKTLEKCNYILHYNIFQVEDTLEPAVINMLSNMPYYNKYKGMRKVNILDDNVRKHFENLIDKEDSCEQNLCLHI